MHITTAPVYPARVLNFSEREARIILSMIVQPGDPEIGQRLRDDAASNVLHWVLNPQLEGDDTPTNKWSTAVPSEAEVERVFRWLAAHGTDVLIPGDEEWPDHQFRPLRLRSIEPYVLYVQGNTGALNTECVAFVGARAASAYGIHAVDTMMQTVVDHGLTVVSGGAYGIDIAAHRAALHHGGMTVSVLAGGLARKYPTAHLDIFERIDHNGGALVSEAPPFTQPNRWRFMARNRIIVTLAKAVVVPEGGTRGGTMDSARKAIEYGITIGAVPGPITSAASNGPNWLLKSRVVHVLTSGEDIIEMLPVMGE